MEDIAGEETIQLLDEGTKPCVMGKMLLQAACVCFDLKCSFRCPLEILSLNSDTFCLLKARSSVVNAQFTAK